MIWSSQVCDGGPTRLLPWGSSLWHAFLGRLMAFEEFAERKASNGLLTIVWIYQIHLPLLNENNYIAFCIIFFFIITILSFLFVCEV